MSETSLTIYSDSDNLLSFRGIEPINGSDLSGALVTYEMFNDLGIVIHSGPMIYIELEPTGYYLFMATIPNITPLSVGRSYEVVVEANAGAGKIRRFVRHVIADHG